MRALTASLSAALVVFAAAPAIAQAPPADSVIQVFRQKARPGMTAEYEAGRKKHMAWHKAQGDTWVWNTYEITTGPDTGAYIIASPGHQWADFDAWAAKFGEGDTADADVSMASSRGPSQMSYWTQLSALSRLPAPTDVSPLLTLTTYTIKPGSDAAFVAAVTKIAAALERGKFPLRSIWYRLSNGGAVPSYAVVAPRANMAAMGPSPSLLQVLEAQLGKPGTEALSKSFYDNVVSVTTELLQRRADLSHLPN